MVFDLEKNSAQELVELYRDLIIPRVIEEKMLSLLRQGRISKWFSGIGQEAISVGATMAMLPDEYILPMHRNLGVFTTRKLPLFRLFSQFQGKANGYTKGRDRSFHFGDKESRIVGMISHLGPQMGLADGIALASKLRSEQRATLVFTGDGGTSEGDFHESVNVAAVWKLPVIFLIENNGYGLSTPSNEQFMCRNFVDKGPGYGIETRLLDGNNIQEVYNGLREIAESIRENPRPVLVECLTFRMRGHEEASGTKYVPQELMDEWGRKDPVHNFEQFLLENQIITAAEAEQWKNEIKKEVDREFRRADEQEDAPFETTAELGDVYAPFNLQPSLPGKEQKEMRLIDAVSDGLREAMRKHPNLVLMGQDIGAYGGVFKITEGFVDEFGAHRVRNTPLCESAILGTGLGLSINGYKAMVEMQFADFVSEGFTQIVNNLAKMHYRWGQNADVVVRMPTGAGVNAGPFHSQSNEAWFTHVPGLKVVFPAFPEDAKGLLISAFEDPNPVMFFEHKALYRSLSGQVPVGYYNLPFGKARMVKEGEQLSIITYGMGVHWALNYLKDHPEISADVIDLRTLVPLDREAIIASVKKTGRALVLHEDTLFGGIGGEIAALINEECFEKLDAPVMRCASMDMPVPFGKKLEKGFLANAELADKIARLLAY